MRCIAFYFALLATLICLNYQSSFAQERAFVSSFIDSFITEINLGDYSVIQRRPYPHTLAVMPVQSNGKIYISSVTGVLESYTDDGTFIRLNQWPGNARGLAADKNDRLWVANVNGFIDVWNTEVDTILTSFKIGSSAYGIFYSDQQDKMVVTHLKDSITFIDTETFEVYSQQSARLLHCDISSDHSFVACTDETVPYLFVYDLESGEAVDTVEVGVSPFGCHWIRNDSFIVVSTYDNNVVLVDAYSESTQFSSLGSVLSEPRCGIACFDVDASGGRLIMACPGKNAAYIFNTSNLTLIDSITAVGEPINLGPFIFKWDSLSILDETHANTNFGLLAFPVPSTGQVNFQLGNSDEQIRELLIHDLQGSLVKRLSGANLDGDMIRVSLLPGIYIASVETSFGLSTVKFIVVGRK